MHSPPSISSARSRMWCRARWGYGLIARPAGLSAVPQRCPTTLPSRSCWAGGGATSREVEDYGYEGRLRHAAASPEDRAKALAWIKDYFDYVRSGVGYAGLERRLKSQSAEPWVRALGLREQQPKWQWVATYDPATDIRKIHFPVLLMFAGRAWSSPSELSLRRWREGLAAARDRDVEWKLFPDADHHFLAPAQSEGWPALAPDYYETQIDWLRHVTSR